jgi:hypothetical protein
MMSPPDRRRWFRADCEIPMAYLIGRKETFYAATVLNSSIDGLYFVSDNAMTGGDDCYILIEKSSEALSRPPDLNLCHATVKWCSPFAAAARARRVFGIGIQIDGWCRSLDSPDIQRIYYHCDGCEEKIVSCRICKTDGPLLLCSKCLQHLQEIPDGPLKQSCLRRLLGNVI